MSPIRLNMNKTKSTDDFFCFKGGYMGNYFFLPKLKCCSGLSTCCGSNGLCISNGCFICQ